MKLLDFLSAEATVDDLKASEKETAIEELLESLVAHGLVVSENAPSILDALMKREELGSTGIGRGIAIPHTKHEGIGKLVGVMGRSHGGVDFKGLDGEPTHLFFLVLSPADEPNQHLHALEQISFLVRDDNYCRFMRDAVDKDGLNDILREVDEKWFA